MQKIYNQNEINNNFKWLSIQWVLNQKYQERLEMVESIFSKYPLLLRQNQKDFAQIIKSFIFAPVLHWGILAFAFPWLFGVGGAMLQTYYPMLFLGESGKYSILAFLVIYIVIIIKFVVVVIKLIITHSLYKMIDHNAWYSWLLFFRGYFFRIQSIVSEQDFAQISSLMDDTEWLYWHTIALCDHADDLTPESMEYLPDVIQRLIPIIHQTLQDVTDMIAIQIESSIVNLKMGINELEKQQDKVLLPDAKKRMEVYLANFENIQKNIGIKT